jgi:hypothetical protein
MGTAWARRAMSESALTVREVADEVGISLGSFHQNFTQKLKMRRVSAKFVIRRTTCARAQFSGCSSTTNAHSETGQMAVCCRNLTLGALSMLVGALFKKFGLFFLTFYIHTVHLALSN